MSEVPKIIALTGLPGSGKSAVREVLENIGYKPVRISQPMKDMCRAIGMTDEHIEGDLKRVPYPPLLTVTPTKLMQALGREVPDAVGQSDMWARLWASRVLQSGAGKVVVEDHRYAYEANWIMGIGMATVWKVERANYEPDAAAMKHAAENQNLDYDDIVFNGGSLMDLRDTVLRMEREFSGPFSVNA